MMDLENRARELIREGLRRGLDIDDAMQRAEWVMISESGGQQLGGLFSSAAKSIKNAVKKVGNELNNAQKTVVNKVTGLVKRPIVKVIEKIGPEKAGMLSSVVAWIPVVGTAAAATLAIGAGYVGYKNAKEAAEVQKELQGAYDRFDANFAKLSQADKERFAQIMKESESSDEKLNGAVLLLDRAMNGDTTARAALRTAIDKVVVDVPRVPPTPAQLAANDAAMQNAIAANMRAGMSQQAAIEKAAADLKSFYSKLGAATPEQIKQFEIAAQKIAQKNSSGIVETVKKLLPFAAVAAAGFLLMKG